MGKKGLISAAVAILTLSAATFGFAVSADPPEASAMEGAAEVGQPMIRLARADMAERRGVPVDAVRLEKLEQVLWPDSCLGVAPPGTVCAQVMTPGFRITVATDDYQFEYRSDEDGRIVLVRRATWSAAVTSATE